MNKILADIQNNKIYQKYQVFVLPAISILICLILLIFIILPNIFDSFQRIRDMGDINQKNDALNLKIKALEQLDVEKYKNDITIARRVLPTDKDVPSALSEVLSLLSTNRLQLQDISLSNSNAVATGVDSFQIKLEVVGDTQSLQSFIKDTKNSLRVIKVDSISTNTAGRDQVQADISLSIYYDALPNKLGGVDQPVKLPTKSDFDLLSNYSQRLPVVDSQTPTIPVGKDSLF